jgi:glycosyltransferase involved in cell wall biosynthesis
MISVVVPTRNEERIISKFLMVLKDALKNKKYEVIIIDDSPDKKTIRMAEKTAKKNKIDLKAIHRTGGATGKGSAVDLGFKKAVGNQVVMIDADLEYDPFEIPKMLEKLDSSDLVVSVRKRKDKWYRKVLGKGFRLLTLILFRINFDTQSGLKVMKKEVAKKIDIKTKSWAWDVELIAKAKKNGFKIKTHEIEFKTRETGESKINPLKSSFEMFFDLLKLRFKI